MNLPDEDVARIAVGGFLHDIGKIGVPHEILGKPGRLTEPEFAIIREHPVAGYEIVRSIDFPWPVARVVLEHHEAWDGSGYPNGLSGEQICPEARIVAVADTVDAVCSHRPYRPALGLPAAMAILRQDRGSKYDVEVVDACIELLERHGYPIGAVEPESSSQRKVGLRLVN